ncbi:GTPase-activating protein gyp3 [Diaporthe helianthi]|uniref:GTPase-activating protein gyp3 n=1 Tax=Diaporthe helianthi TaxID=158607 RepID=A0A2P5HZH2_DIAHE|nr:GTPase-activating protein gyp3 [Diaporthe helianthi]
MAVDLGSLNREKTSTWSRPRESATEISVPPEHSHLNLPRDRGAETHDQTDEGVGRALEAFQNIHKSPALPDHQHAPSDPARVGLPMPDNHQTHLQRPPPRHLRLDSALPPLPLLRQQQPRLQQRPRQGSLPASVSQYSPLHHHHQNQRQAHHLEHRPSHSQPQSLPALSPRQDQFTLSPPNPLPHPLPHPHQHWVPASPRQRRVLPHTDPHFISHDPKHTTTPAQPQPDLSFSSFSPARAQLQHLQTRYPSDTHALLTPLRGHPVYGRLELDGSSSSRPEQVPANVVTTRRQQSLPNTPLTPNSPGYPGPRWDSLPVRRQNSLGQHTSAGLAKTADAPVACDSGIPPSPIRSPQSATFQASLYSHPQIPEDKALDLNLDRIETNRHEHAAAVTLGSPTKMYRPDSRQSGETAYSVATDNYNFSRPRQPSLGSPIRPEFSVPLYLRPGTANTSNSDSARLESRPMASNYIPYSAGPRPVRQPSVASNLSASTFASAAPSPYHKPSYDRFGTAPRNVSQNSARGNFMGLPHAVRPSSPPQNGSGTWAQHPYLDEDEMRSSLRSQLTTSTAQDTLFTEPERSSVQTKTSSIFSSGNRTTNSPFFGPHSPSIEVRESLSVDDVMGLYEQGFYDSDMDVFQRKSSVDPDVPVMRLAPGRMYDQDESRPGSAISHNSEATNRLIEAMNRPGSIAIPGRSFPLNADGAVRLRDTNAFFRKSLASSLPKDMRLSYINAEHKETGFVDFEKEDDDAETFEADSVRHSRHDSGKEVGPHDEYPSIDALEKADSTFTTIDSTPTLLDKETLSPLSPTLASPKIDVMPAPPQPVQGAMQPEDLDPNANDRYGFRKSNQYITREQYDEWDGQYSAYLARRRTKWEAFLKENGLMTDQPNRFPQHSAKAKRFIRKGIPPEWRGAAWFYYAGGPKILANNRGVYDNLVKKAQGGELKEVCRDDIERDLYRTFPDNVRFRRSAPSTGLAPGQAAQSPSPGNTPVHSRNNSTQSANPAPRAPGSEPAIIESLRRVLSAFAIFNPSIGYCQSLNFLGGMLLLFVESEEQAFWLLNIITRVYLPGTHEMNLEGSKVDLSVLMNELEAVLPNVWSKISDDGSGTTKKKPRRARYHKHNASVSGENLPPVSLALTAWFMSCFIGTLPIETTLRVWDVFFYEGSKTLFRVALAIFKAGETEIKSISDPMEVFAVVQTLPRKMVDANHFMDICFKKRSGLNHLTSDAIDQQRTERKEKLQIQRREAVAAAGATPGIATAATIAVSRTRNADDMLSIASGDSSSVRRKHTLFGRRHKERSLEF